MKSHLTRILLLGLLTGLTGFRHMADSNVLVEADGNIYGVTPVFHLR